MMIIILQQSFWFISRFPMCFYVILQIAFPLHWQVYYDNSYYFYYYFHFTTEKTVT